MTLFDVGITHGTYWKGGQIPYWLYVVFVILFGALGWDHLLLRSPIIFFPTVSFDWRLGQAFTFNLGVSMGYNTVVNDYGKRDKSFSILFGTYF